MVFDDVHNLPESIAASASIGLGGGVGGMHQACGTVTGMALVSGFSVQGNPAEKPRIYSGIKEMCAKFADMNGSIVCGELLADKASRKPCMQYIEDSITILHHYLERVGEVAE